jgi:hypothetical protein
MSEIKSKVKALKDEGKEVPKYLIVKNIDEPKKIYKKVKRKEKKAI